MRTQNYSERVNKVILFCEKAIDGFVVVEVNNLRLKNEIVLTLHNKFNINSFTLETIQRTEHLNYNNEKKEIILIDETNFFNATEDSDTFAFNLNYNRDWLADLNRVIVLLMPSWKVTRMITYSNSFWSFVALHVKLNEKNDCFLTPQYIIEGFSIFFSDKSSKRKKLLEKELYGSSIKYAIIKRIENINYTTYNRSEGIEKFLTDCFRKLDQSNDSNRNSFIRSVLDLAEAYGIEKKYRDAKRCYYFIISHFDLSNRQYRALSIEINFSLAYILYENNEYVESLRYLNLILSLNEKENGLISNYDVAIILNNIGLVFYMIDKNNVHLAIESINQSIHTINCDDINSVLGEVLYNASLFSYIVGDNEKALYYIKKAISLYEDYLNRTYRIFLARYQILETFILINDGDFRQCASKMKESVFYLRDELQEGHIYILEAHYVYALLFYQLDNLEQAERCINKAMAILKKIKCNNCTKVHIWALYGIIEYYRGNIDEAQKYMLRVLKRGALEFSDNTITFISSLLSNT